MISISGTFLKFVDPMLKDLGYPNPKKPEFDNVIKIGYTVWNAVAKNDADADPSFLADLRKVIPAPMSLMTDEKLRNAVI